IDISNPANCSSPCTVTPYFVPATGKVIGPPIDVTGQGGTVKGPLLVVFSLPAASGQQPQPVRGGTPAVPAEYAVPAGTSDTLNPGTYYGGICIGAPIGTHCGPKVGGSCVTSNTAPGVVTLNAGVYIMAGGGFYVCGNARLRGSSAVLIYNTVDSGST